MTTPTSNYAFPKPVVGASSSSWGSENNDCWDQVDARLKSVDDAQGATAGRLTAFTGMVGSFLLGAAPAGWIALDGKTMGSLASGGTGRADGDTEALFKALWALGYAVRKSDGTAGTRSSDEAGGADADWTADKALVLPDFGDRVARGFKSGGLGAMIGATQDDTLKDHTRNVVLPLGGDFNGDYIQPTTNSVGTKTIVSGSPSTGAAVETRVKSFGVLICAKL